MQPCGHPDPLIRGEGGGRSSRPLVKGGAWGPTLRELFPVIHLLFSDSLYVRHLSKTDNGFCPSSMHLR